MRATYQEFDAARNQPRPPRFSTWVREFLSKESSKSEYFSFAADLASYVPEKISDRKAFDREAMKFISEFPNKAFRVIQERQVELSTPDLVNIVKKNIFAFIPLLTTAQKEQYRGAATRLSRVNISLNRDKLNKERFILISQLHDLNKLAYDEEGVPEIPLFSDYMYQKMMKEVLSDYYDIEGRSAKELWPHWIEFLKNYPLS